MSNAEWASVVRNALQEGVQLSKGPVPGARLRQLITKHAETAGLTFPPNEDLTFGKFLEQFPDLLVIRKRSGSDMLVVPTESVALLSASSDAEQTIVLRHDLFEAFTLIPRPDQPRPFYLRDTDKIVWPEPGQPAEKLGIPMPASTQDEAISDRKSFAAQAPNRTIQEALDKSIASPNALRAFSETVRTHGLAREWHKFRVGRVLERLKAWSQANNVPWRSDWLQQGEQELYGKSSTAYLGNRNIAIQEFFATLSTVMQEGDLARINIPLDLVAKTWARR